jgi:DNA-binding NarL/FixJ family response regulator
VPVSIILADDHPVVRRGIQALLERERDFSIVGVAADGLEAVRLTERLKPDVLVLDLNMAGLSGLEALRILRERSPRTRIVILSFHSSNAFITQALRDGAVGYVVKGSPEQDLIRAVREASAGGHFLGPPS